MKLDPVRERRRRLVILLFVVPRLLNDYLRPLLGRRRFLFIARLFVLLVRYRKQFARPTDDAGLKEVKQTFLMVGAFYHELCRVRGEAIAFRTSHALLGDIANAVQRQAYLPPPPAPRTWEWFHQEHELQMAQGFIRNNENSGIRRGDRVYSLHITRCRFFEAFGDMGAPELTEAFCRSDEIVFNDYSAQMRFHRGNEQPDTIARGARRCTFVFERVDYGFTD
jgi:hypothetical protein